MARLQDGGYAVYFESNLETSGFGTIVVRGAKVQGGDGGFIYRGYVAPKGGLFFGRIAVIRVDPSAVSVFGPVDRFQLEVSGRPDKGGWRFTGAVEGAEHLRVRFRLVSLQRLAAE